MFTSMYCAMRRYTMIENRNVEEIYMRCTLHFFPTLVPLPSPIPCSILYLCSQVNILLHVLNHRQSLYFILVLVFRSYSISNFRSPSTVVSPYSLGWVELCWVQLSWSAPIFSNPLQTDRWPLSCLTRQPSPVGVAGPNLIATFSIPGGVDPCQPG